MGTAIHQFLASVEARTHVWTTRRGGPRCVGHLLRSMPPPRTFCLAVILYPVWGIAQQFALQNLLARNLRTLVRPRVVRALLTAALFGLAHMPLIPIVVPRLPAVSCVDL